MSKENNCSGIDSISTITDNSASQSQKYDTYEEIVKREMHPMQYQACNNGIDMEEFWKDHKTSYTRADVRPTPVSPKPSAVKPAKPAQPKVKQTAPISSSSAPQNLNTQSQATPKSSSVKTPDTVSQPTVRPSQPVSQPRERNKDKHIFYQECRIAGVFYHIPDECWEILEVGEEVVLIRDKNNLHDKNAVAVAMKIDYEEPDFTMEDILGYIPKTENTEIARFLDLFGTKALYGEISQKIGTEPSCGSMYIKIYYVV